MSAFDPTAMTRPPSIATACAMSKRGLTVMILPLRRTSGREPEDGSRIDDLHLLGTCRRQCFRERIIREFIQYLSVATCSFGEITALKRGRRLLCQRGQSRVLSPDHELRIIA